MHTTKPNAKETFSLFVFTRDTPLKPLNVSARHDQIKTLAVGGMSKSFKAHLKFKKAL